jgi:hypothetical protein
VVQGGWPQTFDYLTSASQVLGFQACTTMPGCFLYLPHKKKNRILFFIGILDYKQNAKPSSSKQGHIKINRNAQN